MRKTILFAALLFSCIAWGQKTIKPSETLIISGEIKTELTFTLADIDELISKSIKDIVISNHLGEAKGTAKNLKGVLLKNLLDKVDFKAENPRLLSEFYLIFQASDGYKVVFSWNEIYNTETGNNIYIITEKDGKSIKDMPDRILLLVSTDLRTGRRYIKGLEKITVARTE